MSYDLVVIGGGPAGYVGAIRAAQLGKKVACVEVERAGGTCLNWGCIPTKALLKSAEFYHQAQRAEEFGFKIGKIEFDFAKIMARSRGVSDQMAKGIEYLFRSKKVDYILGRGQVTSDKKVIVTAADGTKKTLETKNVLLATGCTPKTLPGLKPDGKRVFTSRELLAVTEQPESLLVLGAGAIGVEFAHFLHTLGTKVTIVEMLPHILPVEDEEVSAHMAKAFKKSGIEVLVNTKVEKTEVTDKGVKITTTTPDGAGVKTATHEAEAILVAIGVQANTEGLFGAGVSPDTDRGFLKTDDRYQTTVPGVYGAGDIIGPPWLAHVASHEAIEAVEGMFVAGKKPKKVTVFPGCTYASPQVASIGLTEKKAKEKGIKFKIGKFPYLASGRAVAVGEPEGFVKLIVGEPHGEILGAHIVGTEATELIAEMGLAITLEATTEEIHSTIHAHPTLGEMIAEATLAAEGHPIHI